jgi:hypothetical protein
MTGAVGERGARADCAEGPEAELAPARAEGGDEPLRIGRLKLIHALTQRNPAHSNAERIQAWPPPDDARRARGSSHPASTPDDSGRRIPDKSGLNGSGANGGAVVAASGGGSPGGPGGAAGGWCCWRPAPRRSRGLRYSSGSVAQKTVAPGCVWRHTWKAAEMGGILWSNVRSAVFENGSVGERVPARHRGSWSWTDRSWAASLSGSEGGRGGTRSTRTRSGVM